MKRLLISVVTSVACMLFLLAIGLGSLLPGGAQVLPWHAPQPTHVFVYAIFAVIVRLALLRFSHPAVWTILLAGGAGLLLELAQGLVPVRVFSLQDAGLNFVGAVLGVMVFEGVKAAARAAKSGPETVGEARVETACPADSLAQRVSALSDDRLLAAWPLLLRHGHISRDEAALAEGIQRAKRSMGNPASGDGLVLGALDAAGVRCLLLKGTLLAHTVYDSPEQRERGDTDVLVAPEDRARAEAVLAAQGLARSWTATAKTSDTQDQWHGNVDSIPVTIDLHWALLNHPAFSSLFDFETLWRRRGRVEIDGADAAGLCRADALLHAVLHYFAHHGEEFRPAQWLLDMDLLWRLMEDGERAGLLGRAAEMAIAGLLAEALGRARNRFRTPVPDETLECLREQGKNEWRSGLLQVGDSPFFAQMFKLRAAPSWRARLAHVRALLFPTAGYMRSKYPASSPWALPWLYLRRVIEGVRK